jgi:hypothetical protein
MRNLWRATTYLFWQYPILWLPVILADVITSCLKQIERWLHHQLLQHFLPWLTQSYSVLGPPEHLAPTQATMFKFALLDTPLRLGIQFLGTLLLASAMVATAGLLRSISDTGRGNLNAAMPPFAVSNRRILVYALKLFALTTLLFSFAAFLMVEALNYQRTIVSWLHLSLKSEIALERMNLPGYIASLLATLGIAYIMAPIAIQLLQPSDSNPTPQQAKTARIAWLLTALVAIVLDFGVAQLEGSLLQQVHATSNLAVFLFSGIASLIRTLPYIPLFIAFSLIATPDNPLANPPNPIIQEDL